MSESALYGLHLGKVEVPPKVQNNQSVAKPSSLSLSSSRAETCDCQDHMDPIACAFHLFSDFDTPTPTLRLRGDSISKKEAAHPPQISQSKQEWNCYSEFTVEP